MTERRLDIVRRPSGCKNLFLAKLNNDGTYETPIRVYGLENFQYQPTFAESSAYSDNIQDTNLRKPTAYTLTIQVRQLLSHLKSLIGGKQISEGGGVLTNVNDQAPQFAVLEEQTNSDGSSTLRVFYKASLTIDGHTNQTVGDSITYQSYTLSGSALPDANENIMYEFDNDDEGIDQSLIENFFTTVVQPTDKTVEPTI